MMTLEKARKIWEHYDISEETLYAWVYMVNNLPPDPPDVHKGETIEISQSILNDWLESKGTECP